ncbi:MAG: mechanosensitive ion channel [Flavobacteriales bacterium]|nr:mechanosensitive ion channel [Flavobacteriales bacterium]
MNEFLNKSIFNVGQFDLRLSSVISLIIFILIVAFILQVIRKTINKAVKIDVAKKYAVYNLIKYFILVLSVFIGLQILGLNLSVILAGSAALLVGIGLGLQNLFSDFVSGIILLINAPIKVYDIIEVDNLVCKVQEINLRTTTVLTRDDKYIILPNSELTSNRLINWTHSNVNSRFEIKVGVDYSSDVTLVMKILKEETQKHPVVKNQPQPFVRFEDYGDSSLNFSVFFWSEEVFRVENIKSEIRVNIYESFKKNKVTIPFPQRVVHHRN